MKRIYRVIGTSSLPYFCANRGEVKKMITVAQSWDKKYKGCKCHVTIETYELKERKVVMKGADF